MLYSTFQTTLFFRPYSFDEIPDRLVFFGVLFHMPIYIYTQQPQQPPPILPSGVAAFLESAYATIDDASEGGRRLGIIEDVGTIFRDMISFNRASAGLELAILAPSHATTARGSALLRAGVRIWLSQ